MEFQFLDGNGGYVPDSSRLSGTEQVCNPYAYSIKFVGWGTVDN